MKKLTSFTVLALTVSPAYSQGFSSAARTARTAETITIIACLIGIIISIIVLVKFFQIAADIRAIRQSLKKRENQS